jgi:hypothetical protein
VSVAKGEFSVGARLLWFVRRRRSPKCAVSAKSVAGWQLTSFDPSRPPAAHQPPKPKSGASDTALAKNAVLPHNLWWWSRDTTVAPDVNHGGCQCEAASRVRRGELNSRFGIDHAGSASQSGDRTDHLPCCRRVLLASCACVERPACRGCAVEPRRALRAPRTSLQRLPQSAGPSDRTLPRRHLSIRRAIADATGRTATCAASRQPTGKRLARRHATLPLRVFRVGC